MNLRLPKQNIHWVTIGRVGRVYGIHGWVRINSLTEPHTNIIDYRPWYLWQHHVWNLITVTDVKPHGNTIVAHFENCDTPEQAKKFTNALIGIKREQLPQAASDEYYWTDLIGLAVYNEKKQYLGVIAHLFETGANDILVIQHNSRELLIPYVLGQIVLTIDLTNKIMTVNWDEDYL